MTKTQKRIPVFHVPHDGDAFPKELMASVCVSKKAFLGYHERMRDTAVSEMVPQEWRGSENTLCFPISRLLCDVERFLGPAEPMERLGMGFCLRARFRWQTDQDGHGGAEAENAAILSAASRLA